MKVLVFNIILFIFVVSVMENREQPKTFTLIKSGVYSLRWEEFPITIHADQTSLPYIEIIKNEIDGLNAELGFIAVVLSDKILPPADFKTKNSLNLISFGFDGERGLSFKPSEQGKTTMEWTYKNISKADMKFNKSLLSSVDFPTLFRHELGHFIGMRHDDLVENHIMNTILPSSVQRPWGPALSNWKKDMQSLGVIPREKELASTLGN